MSNAKSIESATASMQSVNKQYVDKSVQPSLSSTKKDWKNVVELEFLAVNDEVPEGPSAYYT